MKRGGEGPEYIRKTVDKTDIMVALWVLEKRASHIAGSVDPNQRGRCGGLRSAIDYLETRLNLLEGHPSRGWD